MIIKDQDDYKFREGGKEFVEQFNAYVQFFLVSGDWVKQFYHEMKINKDVEIEEFKSSDLLAKAKKYQINKAKEVKKLLDGKIKTLNKIRTDIIDYVYDSFCESKKEKLRDYINGSMSLYMNNSDDHEVHEAVLIQDRKGKIKIPDNDGTIIKYTLKHNL